MKSGLGHVAWVASLMASGVTALATTPAAAAVAATVPATSASLGSANPVLAGAGLTSPAEQFWLATPQGAVFGLGGATAYGSVSAPAHPITAVVPSVTQRGYWLVSAKGNVYNFGDAPWYGSTAALGVSVPISTMASSGDGKGYWLVSAKGNVYNFGDAPWLGSMGWANLPSPIVSMTATPNGSGYWILSAKGNVYHFGNASWYGSDLSATSAESASSLIPSTSGNGYWVTTQNGNAAPFGDANGAPPAFATLLQDNTSGNKATLFALAQLGKPYVWGGNGPSNYDCSGLVLAAWSNGAGQSFARVANDQYHSAGTPTSYGNLSSGDLVFWGTTTSNWQSVYHVAMYVGGGNVVNAAGTSVQVGSLSQWGTQDLMPHAITPS